MRILHVAASYLPATRYGGTIVSVHALTRALAARGHAVSVFTTSVDGRSDSPVEHRRPVPVDGVQVSYFRSPLARRIYWSPDLGAALRDQISHFDVVHTHGVFLWPTWVAARTAKAAGVPYVASPRGMLERDLFRRKSWLLKTVWTRVIERRSLREASAVHATSSREAKELTAFEFDIQRLVTIPNGVACDSTPIEQHVSKAVEHALGGPPPIVFIGRISWKKGLDRLIESLRLTSELRVIIAGNDEENYTPTLEGLARELRLEQRVVFVGAVGAADKRALLKQALALVLPSYSENFGNVVLEAMAEGCPVVVTPEVGAADIVRETGAGIVCDGEPPVLSAALRQLADDPALRHEMGQRGTAAVSAFTWDAIASQMEDLYSSVGVAR